MPAPDPGVPAQRIAYEGKIRAYFVPVASDGTGGIANPDAPTVAELTDSNTFDASLYCPKDFLTGDPTQNMVESGDITSPFDAQQVGSWGEALTTEMYIQDPDNDAYDYFNYLDIFDFVYIYTADGDSPKDGDKAVTRRVEVHEPIPLPPTVNAKQRFRMPLAVLQEPSYKATVVAS
jgi:hypothetical protein